MASRAIQTVGRASTNFRLASPVRSAGRFTRGIAGQQLLQNVNGGRPAVALRIMLHVIASSAAESGDELLEQVRPAAPNLGRPQRSVSPAHRAAGAVAGQ